MYRFQLNHNALETRPYPILADKKGNIIGIWQKHYRKVIGFSCLPQTGCVDVTFEQFTETKQSLRGMYAIMECANGDFCTLQRELEGAYIGIRAMPKLTKQDIQDIANGYTIKYVSNSSTKDELIIELAQLCLQAIDEKEDILLQPVELDEEE